MISEHEGRTAVITGAARGLGRAIANALANKGAKVALLDRDGDEAEVAAARMRTEGSDAHAFACDVTDEAQVGLIFSELARDWGGIDYLINNAGLYQGEFSGPFEGMGLAKVRRLFDVNVMGAITCMMLARQHMEGRTAPSIVNISSAAATMAGTAYGITKLTVKGLTLGFAREFSGYGIRVNAIAPGMILTESVKKDLSDEMIGYVMAQQVIPRKGKEGDIVAALLYLLSSDASFISGETLRVSGGLGLDV